MDIAFASSQRNMTAMCRLTLQLQLLHQYNSRPIQFCRYLEKNKNRNVFHLFVEVNRIYINILHMKVAYVLLSSQQVEHLDPIPIYQANFIHL